MLISTNWRLRGQRLYGIKGDRSPLVLCRNLTSSLVRIDSDFKGDQAALRKAGTIQQVVNGIKSGDQPVPFESRYYVFPVDLGAYSLQWTPIASLPPGYLQIWEYIGSLSSSEINQLIAYSNGDSMPLSNPVTVNVPSSAGSVSTLTTVAAAAATTAILPANAARKDVKIHNNSTARLYLAWGATASTASFTVLLEAGGFYEMAIAYTGAISGIWTAANGNALVTELT